MLTLYIVSAAVAGVLILLSLMGADHGVEHEVHFEHDSDHDTGHQGHWLPFLSIRFYTYFFAGLGLTGLLLHWLTQTPANLVLWLSLGVAVFSGFSVSIFVRILRKGETTSATRENDVLGREAEVLVTIRGTTPGRIRCTVKGDTIDYLAVTDEPQPIEAGTSVIVVAMEEGRSLVMSRAALFSDDELRLRSNS
jgi:membrane protein implicated in regulation of membrane protease activity